jgi:hypothetical protein
MKRREFISCVIAACFAVIIPADPTHTQTTKQAAAESTLAVKIVQRLSEDFRGQMD